jgi:transposase-like protein
MLGFKSFRNATVTISGIELVQKIRKGQFNTSAVVGRERARVRRVWEAVLAA